MCGLDSDKAKSQSDTRARRGPAGDARAVVALPPMDPSERKATGRGVVVLVLDLDGWRPMDAPRKPVAARKRARSRHSTGKRAETAMAVAAACLRQLHAHAYMAARSRWHAARREPWPQSWSLLGPSIVPAARAANNLMRVPCVRDRSATDVPVWPCACTRGAEALPCLASPGRGSVPAATARPSLSARRARAPRLLPYGIAMAYNR